MYPPLPRLLPACAAVLCLLAGCRSEPELLELLPADRTGIQFANTIRDDARYVNALSFDNVYNGGGVGIGDLNGDGREDVFFTGNMVSNRLYLNRGDFRFDDVTARAGLTSRVWCTGVALADVNTDGRLDVFVAVAGTNEQESMANLLYLNQGNDGQGVPRFREVAASIGLADSSFSVQAAFFDYDRDGDLDVYVLNNALENSDKNALRPKKTHGEAISNDRLYRNDGGRFTDVTQAAGILTEGFGLGVAVTDLDKDGWPDVYVSNDFLTNDLVWMNNRDGTFTNRAGRVFKHQSSSAMGNDVADVNNDLLPDVYTLDMLPEDRVREKMMMPVMSYSMTRRILDLGYEPQYMRNTLQLNQGAGADGLPTYAEIGQLAGVAATDWSWAPLLADLDNDGHRDLLVSTGHRKDLTNLDFIVYGQRSVVMGTDEARRNTLLDAVRNLPPIQLPNYVFRNNGDLTFTNKTDAWGFGQPTVSQGMAYGDLDNDGDLDVVVSNMDGPASVYRNRASEAHRNHFLRVRLKGPAQNPYGFGAKVVVRYGAHQQYAEASPFRGFQSTVESVVHFGLGAAARADAVEVTWPDGRYQRLTGVRADQVLVVDHARASAAPPAPAAPAPLLADVTGRLGPAALHAARDVDDFRSNPLWVHQLSDLGPGLATGDVDGNGLDDVYLGADAGHPRAVYLQTAPGRFTPRPLPPDTAFTDAGALLLDADGDGHQDLYVVSGGYEPPAPVQQGGSVFNFGAGNRRPAPDTTRYQDRLYLGDGHGGFTRAADALPRIFASGSSVAAADFDADGDLDLFVGGRADVARYPLPPRSYLLRNDSRPGAPRFTDATPALAPALARIGLVSSALWTDFDADGRIDLLVAGEWMPLTFLRNTGRGFTDVTDATGLGDTSGWWNSLAAADFDDDGDTDYLAGNFGDNGRFRAAAGPLRIYAADFDRNGAIDPVVTQMAGGDEYPVYARDLLIAQVPGFKLRFKTYRDYAEANLERTFSRRELEPAYRRAAAVLQSSYLENLGGGKFRRRALPRPAQFAPVFGMLPGDFTGDGRLDVLLVGNWYGLEPMGGRMDALDGLLLAGDGRGAFRPVPGTRSGFRVPGDARALAEVQAGPQQTLVLAAQRADSLRAFARPLVRGERLVRAAPLDRYALLQLPGGRTRRQELYYGSTALSQGSRVLRVPAGATARIGGPKNLRPATP